MLVANVRPTQGEVISQLIVAICNGGYILQPQINQTIQNIEATATTNAKLNGASYSKHGNGKNCSNSTND